MSATARFCEQFDSGNKKSVRERKAKALPPVEVAVDDARRRAASGEWNYAKGATYVGLYALCHQMIYGILPDELYTVSTFRIAARAAAKTLHELFDDDAGELAEFVRWAWEREKRKHNWALAQGFDRSRLSWRVQFSRTLLTDYRISKTQRRY